jgi:predicted PurR-regulated permease PerM
MTTIVRERWLARVFVVLALASVILFGGAVYSWSTTAEIQNIAAVGQDTKIAVLESRVNQLDLKYQEFREALKTLEGRLWAAAVGIVATFMASFLSAASSFMVHRRINGQRQGK